VAHDVQLLSQLSRAGSLFLSSSRHFGHLSRTVYLSPLISLARSLLISVSLRIRLPSLSAFFSSALRSQSRRLPFVFILSFADISLRLACSINPYLFSQPDAQAAGGKESPMTSIGGETRRKASRRTSSARSQSEIVSSVGSLLN